MVGGGVVARPTSGTRTAKPQKGDAAILRTTLTLTPWFGKPTRHRVAAKATVMDVAGRSVWLRVKARDVGGIPRRFRGDAAELMEGWHNIDEVFARPVRARSLGGNQWNNQGEQR